MRTAILMKQLHFQVSVQLGFCRKLVEWNYSLKHDAIFDDLPVNVGRSSLVCWNEVLFVDMVDDDDGNGVVENDESY